MLTCMRLLGNRSLSGEKVIAKQKELIRQKKTRETDVCGIDDVAPLIRALGYVPHKFKWKEASNWKALYRTAREKLTEAFRAGHPVMIGVQRESDHEPGHWIVAYSDPDDGRQVWTFDPDEKRAAFEKWPWNGFLDWACSTRDYDHNYYFEGCIVSSAKGRKSDVPAVPPSSALFAFIENGPDKGGWMDFAGRAVVNQDYAAVVIHDNYCDTLQRYRTDRETIAAATLLEKRGAIIRRLDDWSGLSRDAGARRKNFEQIRRMLHDIARMRNDRVDKQRADAFAADMALLFAMCEREFFAE